MTSRINVISCAPSCGVALRFCRDVRAVMAVRICNDCKSFICLPLSACLPLLLCRLRRLFQLRSQFIECVKRSPTKAKLVHSGPCRLDFLFKEVGSKVIVSEMHVPY